MHFRGHENSPGLKRGGVLNVVRHEVSMLCPVDNIPEYIEGDLSGLDIGNSLHISAFTLPEGVKPMIRERDFTVATIAPPTTYTEEVPKPRPPQWKGEEAAAPAEGAEGAALPPQRRAPGRAAAPAGREGAAAPGGKAPRKRSRRDLGARSGATPRSRCTIRRIRPQL